MHPFTSQDRRIDAWLTGWDSQGPHRTATNGDQAGADWLAGEARSIGAAVEEETFELERLDPLTAYVEFEGQRIDGEMLFDAPATPIGGTTGRPHQEIGIRVLSPRAVYTAEFRQMRREAACQAMVIVTRGERPGLALLNAESFNAPYGPPVLQVGSEASDQIHAAAARGAMFHVSVNCQHTRATARNTVIRLAGRDPLRPPLVVMTPRSSWFRSTSERGGGLVCWLETLRTLIASPPSAEVVFTANTGHELGHLGLDAFMHRRPGWETRATWVHYGANIDAQDGELRVVSATDELRALGTAMLAQAGRAPDFIAPGTEVPAGESRDIHLAGGRYITLVGTNPMFHLPQDHGPDVVDRVKLGRTARGAAALVVALSR